MFQKNLPDLVKGIRANKKNEEKYIQEAIAEIKRELKSPDMKIKATGIEKLTYLHMIGYDMEWAAFHVIEVMSQPQFHFKRIGYLAASQSFNEKTDVMVLTTQTFKVDIKSNDQYEAGIAINCLANICTPDLARDLVADVVTQVSSSKPYVRKKSVLALYRIFLKYPDALRPSFPRLKERLEDQDPAVISCAVNVICELARKNPQNYLGMAPLFYKLLTTLTNNWTLIKIVKLFGALTPLEPRLAKKLVEPLTNIINTTPAKSLLYECLNTVSKGMTKHLSIVRLAVEKLRMFVEDPDQNLKYLGLLGLTDILKTYPRIVADLKEVILDCLNDEDVTIRLRALDLLTGVATKKNLVDIIRKLMQHVHTSEGSYRDDLVEKIINTCKQNNYECIVNFQWYISVLMELTEVKGIKHGGLIAQQLMDVIIRVKGIRPYGAKAMVSLLNSPHLVDETSNQNSMHEVLYAAAWIVGEFVRYVEDPLSVLDSLLQPRIEKLPSRIQSVYVQAVLKVYACAAYPPVPQPVQQLLNTEGEGGEEQPDQPEVYFSHTSEESRISMLRAMRDMIASRFGIFLKSADIEVQERATTCLRILEIHASLLEGGTDISAQLAVLFDEDLNPVGPKAQKKVPVPQGLNLDEWINEPFEDPEKSGFEFLEESGLKSPVQEAPAVAPTATTALGATAVDRRKEYDIWYISKDSPTSKPAEQATAPVEDKKKKDYDLNLGFERKPKKKGTKKGKKGKKHAEEEEQEEAPPARHLVVNSGYEMPENAVESDEEEKPDDKLNIDLRTPIREDEVLPTIKAYPKETVAKPAEPEKTEKPKTEKKKKKKDGKEKKSSNSGDKEKKKSKKKGEESKKDELINFFDDLAVSAGTPTAQPAAAAEEKPKRKKKEKSSKDKKETKEKKEKKSSSSKSSKTSAASTSAAAAQSPSHKPYLKKLAEDDNLTISYNTQVQPISANNIMVPLILQNIGSASIASIEYNLTDTMNTRLIRTAPPSQPLSAMFTLAPGGTNNVILQLTFNSFNRPQKLSGQVNYKLQGQPDPIVLPFQLTLPCSVFITPVPITPDACRDLVASQACPHLSSTRVTLNNRTLQAAFNDLANLLRVRVVEVVDSHAALYGRSVQDDHVLVLVKARSATEISVEIKSSDENLGTNLLREVTSYFQTE